ncbi:hypothetical protein LJK88_11855 [Paenibacillus sp. P26]|nr:hypothetical protein LJK88_11855 [Paenibacillus sp. P26]
MTINEIYFVDTSAGPSPYDWLLSGAKRSDKKSFDNSYVFIFKVKYDLGQKGNRGGSFLISDRFNMGVWADVSNPQYIYGGVGAYHVGVVDSYMIFARDKKDFEGKGFYPRFIINNKIYDLLMPDAK